MKTRRFPINFYNPILNSNSALTNPMYISINLQIQQRQIRQKLNSNKNNSNRIISEHNMKFQLQGLPMSNISNNIRLQPLLILPIYNFKANQFLKNKHLQLIPTTLNRNK